MAARSTLFKTISLLVIIVMVMANFNVVQAQDNGPETPTPTPQAEVTNIPSPTAPAETIETPTDAPTEVTPTPAPTEPTLQVPTEPAAGALPASFSISGKVTEKDGQGLTGVEISAGQDGQNRHVQTDESGFYSIDGLTPGKYLVSASLSGVDLIPYFRVARLQDQNVTGVDFYPRPQPQPEYTNSQPLPVNHRPVVTDIPFTGGGEIESQAVTQPGLPGTAYVLDPTGQIGTTGVPYTVEALDSLAHLNAPTALALDTLGHLWEAEEHGNRLVAFKTTSLVPELKIGDKPGISLMDHFTFNSLMAVGYQPGSSFLWVGDTTRLVKYDTSLAYPDSYRLQFPDADPWQSGNDQTHFSEIRGIAFNSTGDEMYVSDRFNHRIQVYDVSGPQPAWLRTMGTSGVPGNGASQFNQPWHITYFDGFLYVADSQNHRIQKCPTNGDPCSTVAGSGDPGAELNQLNTPAAVAVTSSLMYIADSYNQRVLRCDFDGSIANNCQVFAGVTGEPGSDTAHLRWPADVTVIGSHVYLADRDNHRILDFQDPGTSDPGVFNRQIGTTAEAYPQDAALAPQTHVYQPWGIATDIYDDDIMYVAENWGYSLAKFYTSGPDKGKLAWRVPADAGNYGSDLHHFGNFSGSNRGSIAVDGLDRIFVPDSGNNRVMIYLSNGTIFGQIGTGQRGNGPNQFSCPNGVGLTYDYIYVADTCNQRIQIFDWEFKYAGTIGQTGIAGADSDHFSNPVALVGNPSGNDIFVVDQGNQRVQHCQGGDYSMTYTCTPFAGVTGVSGGRDFHYLNHPASIAYDRHFNNILISEEDTSRIQVFNAQNGAYLTTISGQWGSENGNVRSPTGITVNGDSTVYVADSENARIQSFFRNLSEWSQLNINGFGSPFNENVTGLTYIKVPYKGALTLMLYTVSQGQVWRQLPDDTWQAVSAPGFGDPSNNDLTEAAFYNDSFYVGTSNTNSAQIWRCEGLPTNPCEKPSDWTQVSPPPGFSSNNHSVSRMIEFNDQLFISYMNWSGSGPYTSDGGEVWVYDGAAWTSATPLIKLDPSTTGTSQAINGFISMTVNTDGSMMYAGTSDDKSSPPAPAQLYAYAYNSGSASWKWVRVRDNGLGNPNNLDVSSLLATNHYLYAGMTNYHDGGSIYRFSDTDLSGETQVVSSGFDSLQNVAITAMKADVNGIYAVAANPQTGFHILSAPFSGGVDGVWSSFTDYYGLGNTANYSISGDSSFAFTPEGHLLIGTWNNLNGGAVWRYVPSSEYYHISGHIDYSGTELTGISVVLQPSSISVSPNSSGDYTFNFLAPGAYTVSPQFYLLGFSPPAQPVTIRSASVDGVNFTAARGGINLLQPSNGTQLTSLDPLTLQWSPLPGATSYTLQVSSSLTFSPLLKTVTQTGSTFKLAGLLANKTYYWKVRKANSPTGDWSVVFFFKTPVLGPPAAPLLQAPLNAAALPAGTLAPASFTWKPAVVPAGSAPVLHYHIQVSRVNTFVPLDVDEYTPDATTVAASTTFIPTANLTPNQVYYWRVRAFNTLGDASVWSAIFSFKVLPVPPLTALAYETNTLQPGFHWTDPYCAGKYLVEVYKSTTTLSRVISTPVTTGALCEGDFQLTASLLLNTKYEWHITTQGATGSSTPFTGTFTTPFSVPGVPALSSPANNAIIPDNTYLTWQPKFSWNPVSATAPIVQNYHIQVATQPGFGAYTYIDTSVDALQTSFTLPDALKYNTSVYWRVRSCDSNKNCSVWSAARKLTTRPATPDTTSNEYNSLQVLFRWHDPGGNSANSYNIIIYSNAACTTLFKSATVTTNSYSFAVPANKSICWKVGGIGPASSITGAYSAPSYFGPLSVLPAPPLTSPPIGALVSASAVSPPSYADYPVTFQWDGTTGASYHIQISRTSDFNNLVLDNTTLSVPTLSYAFSGGKYYWRVRAGTGGIFGGWSVARNFSTRGQLLGSVHDDMGASVPDVVITISGVPGAIPVDGSGSYAADNLPTGAHTLTFSKGGYLNQTRSLSFANGVQYQGNAVLIPKPASDLLRIILTWDPTGNRRLGGHLWLPTGSTAMHIFDPNVGKPDLNVFPNAFAHVDTNFLGTTYFDIKPQVGKYVFGVNQEVPATNSWSGSAANVEVYSGITLKKSCPLPSVPSGSGSWWYALDLTVTSTSQTVTCKANLRTASPAPYPDHPISGKVNVATTSMFRHPLQGVVIRYDYGQVMTDPYGKFTINGLISGGTTLYPEISPANFTFAPLSIPAVVDTASNDFAATPISSMLGVPAPSAVTLQGDYAYIGAGRWLYILNVKNKAAPPVFVSRLWLGGSNDDERINQIFIDGHNAFVVANSIMDIIAIGVPAGPYYQTMLASPNGTLRRVAVSGNYAYLASSNFFYIYNWVQSSAEYSPLTWAYSLAMGGTDGAMDVALQGKYAYVVGAKGLSIFDVTNPMAPVGPWFFATADPLSEVEVDGAYAYVYGTNKLSILDITDPAHVIQVSGLDYAGYAMNMRKSGSFLYLPLYRDSPTSNYGLTIIDVTAPLHPTLRGNYHDAVNLYNGMDVSVQEDNAFLVQSDTGLSLGRLSLINLANKDAPAEGSSYTPGP